MSWDSVTGAASYDVRRATSSGGTYTSLGTTASTSYDDTTATPGTTYYYKVLATNTCGSSALSTWNGGYRGSTPGVPSGVSATDGTYCDKVRVSWNSVPGATSYDVHRATSSGGSYASIGTTGSTSYDDATATKGTTYYYKVLASSICGSSTLSTWNDGYRMASLTPPTGVAATDGDYCDVVQITWNPVGSATWYEIYRSSSGASYAYFDDVNGSTYTWNDSTATPGVTYYYRVMACNSCGSAYSPTQYDTGYRGTTPSVPTGVSATDSTLCDKVTISWNSVTGATSYEVHRATSSGGSYSSIGTTGSTSYDDTTATPETAYYYKVLASSNCASSALSSWNEGTQGSAPSAPIGVSATDGDHCDKVTITWSSVSGATSYEIYRATSSGGSYSSIGTSGSTSYDDTTAALGATYYYKVSACKSCGCSTLSAWDDGYRKVAPGFPSGVSATDGTYCDKVTVSWGSVTGATSYEVYRATSSGGSYSSIGTSGSNSYDDTTATPGVAYYYKVLATNDCGSSALSSWNAGNRMSVPGVPPNVSASYLTYCDKITVSWNSVAGAVSYEVWRATSSGGTYSSIGTTASTSYDDTTVTPQTSYYYKVSASNGCVSSALSNYERGIREGIPPAPSGVAATDGTYCDKVTVSWFIPSNATACEVYRATSSGGTYVSIGTTGVASSYDDTTATPGTTYYYKVLASNFCGSSSLSNWDDGYRDSVLAPTGVHATDGLYCERVALTWGSVSGATSYVIHRAPSSGGTYSSLGATASLSYYDTTGTPGTVYYYKISACKSCGCGALSDWTDGYRRTVPTGMATNIEASDATYCATIDLSWSSVSNATSYDIYRATSSGGTYSLIGSDDYGILYCDWTAEPWTTYYYKILASNPCGSGALSSEWDDGYREGAPDVPTGVSATGGNCIDAVTVSWDSMPNATQYYIYRATSSDGSYAWDGQTSGTSHDDEWAESGIVYYYKVYASGDCASSAFSDWDDAYITRVLEAPDHVDASEETYCDKVLVSWDSVTGATSYEVYRATSWNGSYSSIGTTTSTSYDDTTVTPWIDYYYKVRATNSCGPGDLSINDDGVARGVTAVPSGVAANGYCNYIRVSWNDVTGATSYEIHRATSSGGSYSSIGTTGSTSYDDTTATPGTTYYYKVLATNSCGSSALSSYDAGERDSVPDVPTGVSATDGTICERVHVAWSYTSGATSYEIHRATSSGGSYSSIGTADLGRVYGDTTATPGTTYYYKVLATNSCGSSALSGYDAGERDSVPDVPTGVDATDGTHCDNVPVSWSPAAGATSYELRRATSSGGSYSEIGITTSTSYVDWTATPGTTYYYKVLAKNFCGSSALSDWDAGTRDSVPDVPAGVSATDGTSCDEVTISWSSASGASSYEIHRATSSGGSYSEIGSTGSTSYDDTTATPGTAYYYKVLATNSCGSSALSSYDDGYRDSAPDVPTGIAATDGTSSTEVTITWSSASGASLYAVYRADSSGGSYSEIGTTGSTSYDDTTATPDIPYYYKVLATNSCGDSALSDWDDGYRASGE